MINDERIDLTERRDFGTHSIIHEVVEYDEFMDRAYEGENMTNDEYESLVRHESIFGRNRHFNRKHEIFRPDEHYYSEEMHTHCFRCGKEVRFPWGKKHDLCPECDEAMRNKIPWNENGQLVSFGPDRAMDVFNLR